MSILSRVSVALVDRWRNYEPLVTALGGPHVFSRSVPPDFVFPDPVKRLYITVGDKTETDGMRVMGDVDSFTDTVQTHGWTHGYYDDAPAEELVKHMGDALREPFVFEGYGGVVLRRELAVVMGDPAGDDIRHAPVRYRISTMGAG